MKLSCWILGGTSLLLGGCGGNKVGAQTADDARQRRETEIVLEECDVASESAEKIDANGDGKPELIRVTDGEREICRSADLNFDGKPDRTTFFDDSGKRRKVESDFDRDGVVDEIAVYKSGLVSEKHRATTLDGKLDTWDFFEKGALARTERDENGDGVIDQWWEYPQQGCPLIHVDADGDGRPDPGASIDYCKETGYVPPPLHEEGPEQTQDFGARDERVEETSNVKEGEEPSSPKPEGSAATDTEESKNEPNGASGEEKESSDSEATSE